MTLPRGRLAAIASGKGGVGKTWLAITLAHALARAGQRVLLFDADLGLANVDIQLGLLPSRDLVSALTAGADPLTAAQPYAPGGFDIVAGRSGSAALTQLAPHTLAAIATGLRAATARYDLVLADLAAGLDPATRHLAALADTLLLVATPEPTSLTDAYAVLKLHLADGGSADRRVVVNAARSKTAATQAFTTLHRTAQTFLNQSLTCAGTIRHDEKVPEAIRRQALFLNRYPTANAASDVEDVARGLRPPDPPLGP